MKRSRAKAINWLEISRAYIEGTIVNNKHEFPTNEQLAEQFGVSPSSIGHRSAKEKWTGARARFLQDITKEARRITVSKLAQEGETALVFFTRSYKRFKSIEDYAFSKFQTMGEDGNLTVNPDLSPFEARTLLETMVKANDQLKLIHGMVTGKAEVEVTGNPIHQVLTLIARRRDELAQQHEQLKQAEAVDIQPEADNKQISNSVTKSF